MPKKGWVEKAAKSGDWTEAEKKATTALRQSRAKILKARAPNDGFERIFEGIEPDSPEPADTSDDAVQEHIDDAFTEDADILPTDDQERALRPAGTRPVVRFSRAYQDYLKRGGNRALEDRVLNYFATWDVDDIDRAAAVNAARELYPGRSQAARAELVYDPLAEVLGSFKKLSARTMDPSSWLRERERYYAEQERIWKIARSKVKILTPEEERRDWYRRAQLDWLDDHDFDGHVGDRRWARISRPLGPPRDPPAKKEGPFYVRASHADHWRHRHRGVLSALRRGADEPDLKFGYPPRIGQSRAHPYYGYEPLKSGRPAKSDKLTRAQIQKAYRERRKSKHKK